MIEIKDEDIILDWKGMDEIHVFYSEEQLGKQLKQQILQNQKLRELVEKRLSNLSDAPRDNSVAGNDAEQERLKYKLFLAQLLEESKT